MLPATRNVKPDWLRLVQLKLKRFELEGVLAARQQPTNHQPEATIPGEERQWRHHPYYCHSEQS